jgi:hypothetical protein
MGYILAALLLQVRHQAQPMGRKEKLIAIQEDHPLHVVWVSFQAGITKAVLGVREWLLARRVARQRDNGVQSHVAGLAQGVQKLHSVVVAYIVPYDEALDACKAIELNPLLRVGLCEVTRTNECKEETGA